MKKGDLLPPELVRAVREFAEQRYRYITFHGEVFDKPFWERFHRRAEFKATAVTIGVVAATAELVFNAGLLTSLEYVVGGLYGYASRRSSHAQIEDFFKYAFGHVDPRHSLIIDKKPEPSMRTSPDNLLKAESERQRMRERLNMSFQSVAMGVFPTVAIFTTFNMMGMYQAEELIVQAAVGLATISSGIGMAYGCEAISSNIATSIRMDRVLSGEYVILSEPPAKQERLVHETSPYAEPLPSPT